MRFLCCSFILVCNLAGSYRFNHLFAQSSPADTAKISKDAVVDYYRKEIGVQSWLFNGPEYNLPNRKIKGSPNFADGKAFESGNVTYDHIEYKNVPMIYDEYQDLLVILMPDKVAQISLLNYRVQNFDLLDHHFVYLNAAGLANKDLRTGFYDQLYKGKTALMIKRTKYVENSSITDIVIEKRFQDRTKTFVMKNGEYFTVSGKSSFLKTFDDKKAEIKAFIRNNQINFKDSQDQAMIKVAAYYDLINQ